MVGTTLRELRDRIESLASDGGRYYLCCARTGERPVPVTNERFPDRDTAVRAARATEQYRAALRRYDPRAPCYDVIACEEHHDDTEATTPASVDAEDDWSLSEPVFASRPTTSEHSRRITFCHDVAAAVFESLAAGGYDAVEDAVMDAYFDLAEKLPDPNDLCLCLLESVAVELDRALSPGEQADVLRDAAARMGPIEDDGDPLAAAFERFEAIGIVDGYERSPWMINADGSRSAEVDVDRYALSPTDDRLPVVPFVVDLYRRGFDGGPTRVTVTDPEEDWTVRIELGRDEKAREESDRRGGLACASIGEGD